MGKYHGYHIRRIEDIELLLPPRMQLEPKPGDNPLHRPYPEHARDMKILSDLLAQLNEEFIEHKYIDRDLRVRIPAQGVLFIHALDIKNLVLSSHHFLKGTPFCVYVELECQDTIKCSDPVYSLDLKKVRIDHSVHMYIELSEFRMDERNEFFIHVYAFQDPEHQHLIGSQKVHMYDFVRELHGITKLTLINELSYRVGDLTYEFAWAYGSFGYGFSNQLLNSKTDLFENICHSMFPRIKLKPDDLVDNKINARIPQKLRLVTLHSLLLRKAKKNPSLESTKAGAKPKPGAQLRQSFGNKGGGNKGGGNKKGGSDYAAKNLVFRRVKYCRGTPIHVSLNLDIHQKFMEDDFNNSYGEYICLRNRRDRLTWLTKLTEGRLRDKVEFDATELFKPFKEVREVRRTLSLKRPLGAPPALVEFTDRERQKICEPIEPLTVIGEDDVNDKFIQEKLASAPRTSGYLAYVFGYEKPPPSDEQLKKFEYKVDPKAAKEGGQFLKDGPNCCQRLWLCFAGLFYRGHLLVNRICEFIFPTFERLKDDPLPEISVTMPSPEHSTTDFHSFCTQKQFFERETDLDKTRRRAKHYIQMARRARKEDMDLEDFEEFLVPSEAYIGERRNQRGGGGDNKGVAPEKVKMATTATMTSTPTSKTQVSRKNSGKLPIGETTTEITTEITKKKRPRVKRSSKEKLSRKNSGKLSIPEITTEITTEITKKKRPRVKRSSKENLSSKEKRSRHSKRKPHRKGRSKSHHKHKSLKRHKSLDK